MKSYGYRRRCICVCTRYYVNSLSHVLRTHILSNATAASEHSCNLMETLGKRKRYSSKMDGILRFERLPTTLQGWRKLHNGSKCFKSKLYPCACICSQRNCPRVLRFTVKFGVKYKNGKRAVVDCRNTKPVEEFIPPEAGMSICTKVKGAKYQARILELFEVY